MTDATRQTPQAAAATRARGRGRPRPTSDASQTTASAGTTAASRNGARRAPAKLGALIEHMNDRLEKKLDKMSEHIRGIERRLS